MPGLKTAVSASVLAGLLAAPSAEAAEITGFLNPDHSIVRVEGRAGRDTRLEVFADFSGRGLNGDSFYRELRGVRNLGNVSLITEISDPSDSDPVFRYGGRVDKEYGNFFFWGREMKNWGDGGQARANVGYRFPLGMTAGVLGNLDTSTWDFTYFEGDLEIPIPMTPIKGHVFATIDPSNGRVLGYIGAGTKF